MTTYPFCLLASTAAALLVGGTADCGHGSFDPGPVVFVPTPADDPLDGDAIGLSGQHVVVAASGLTEGQILAYEVWATIEGREVKTDHGVQDLAEGNGGWLVGLFTLVPPTDTETDRIGCNVPVDIIWYVYEPGVGAVGLPGTWSGAASGGEPAPEAFVPSDLLGRYAQ